MPSINLEFPVLVKPGKNKYTVEPLFTLSFTTEAERFRDSLERLIKLIKRHFLNYTIDKDNINYLLWYVFNPEVSLKHTKFQFHIGQHYIDGYFTLAQFKIQDQLIVYLPDVDQLFIPVKQEVNEYGSIHFQIEQQLQGYLKEQKKLIENFDTNDYMSSQDEFLTTIDFTVNIKQAAFPFEYEGVPRFALGNKQEEFDGEYELTKVGKNWCDYYPEGLKRAILRDSLVEQLINIIFSDKITALALVGPSGAGKTTLLQEALYRYLERHYQQVHRSKHAGLWYIDPTRIISGMSIVGQWERRLESILAFVTKRSNPKTTHRLYIDNAIALFRVGQSAGSDMTLSDVIKPYLEERKFTFLIEATEEEWSKIQELDRRFADLFEVMHIREASPLETASMLIIARRHLEQKYACQIEETVLPFLLKQNKNLLGDKVYPGSLIDFLYKVLAKKKKSDITVSHLEEEIKSITQINPEILEKEQPLAKDKITSYLQQRLIGQAQVVTCLTQVILTFKAGLQDPSKPIASFLFIGPTGVGKTQAAKELTRYLFTEESHLLRLDMNEFISEYDVERLIGSWRQADGLLTSQVRYQPFSILLLDEIEKAHPAVHDLLLQVLGEGRLTDALGKTTDFSRCIIILTSNLGAKEANQKLGFTEEDIKSQASSYRSAVEKFFRPEFINRLDDIIIFNALKPQDAIHILKLQLSDLLKRDGFLRRTTILNISLSALEMVASTGFSQALGGRALKRSLEKDLTLLAAHQLVNLPLGQPILLTIDYIKGHLIPQITTLVPVTNQAPYPLEDILKPNITLVNTLLEQLNQRVDRLYQLREIIQGTLAHPSEDLLRILELQNNLLSFKNSLEEVFWALESAKAEEEISNIAVRKKIRHDGWATSASSFNFLYNQAHQQDIIDYLEEVYNIAPKLIQTYTQGWWLTDYIQIKFLEFFCDCLEKQGIERQSLYIYSLVTGYGHEEIQYLKKQYETSLNTLGLHVSIQETAAQYICIEVQGLGIKTLLNSEQGVHVFHHKDGSILPILVSLESQDIHISHTSLKTIRSYTVGENQTGVLYDLGTGLINRRLASGEEWILLWYLNLAKYFATLLGR